MFQNANLTIVIFVGVFVLCELSSYEGGIADEGIADERSLSGTADRTRSFFLLSSSSFQRNFDMTAPLSSMCVMFAAKFVGGGKR